MSRCQRECHRFKPDILLQNKCVRGVSGNTGSFQVPVPGSISGRTLQKPVLHFDFTKVGIVVTISTRCLGSYRKAR